MFGSSIEYMETNSGSSWKTSLNMLSIYLSWLRSKSQTLNPPCQPLWKSFSKYFRVNASLTSVNTQLWSDNTRLLKKFLSKYLSESILHVLIPEAENERAEERGDDSVGNCDHCVISPWCFWLQIHNRCKTKVDDDHCEVGGTGRKGLPINVHNTQ